MGPGPIADYITRILIYGYKNFCGRSALVYAQSGLRLQTDSDLQSLMFFSDQIIFLLAETISSTVLINVKLGSDGGSDRRGMTTPLTANTQYLSRSAPSFDRTDSYWTAFGYLLSS